MNTVKCPDPICTSGLIVIPDNVELGDVLECAECAAEVEVVELDPLEIRLITEEK